MILNFSGGQVSPARIWSLNGERSGGTTVHAIAAADAVCLDKGIIHGRTHLRTESSIHESEGGDG